MRAKFSVAAAALVAFLTLSTAHPVWAQAGLTDGLVTKIDVSAGKMTIRHGPMKKFDMEDGMTMVYRVQEPAMLKAVKPGDKIKFDAEHVNGQFIVTKIEKAK